VSRLVWIHSRDNFHITFLCAILWHFLALSRRNWKKIYLHASPFLSICPYSTKIFKSLRKLVDTFQFFFKNRTIFDSFFLKTYYVLLRGSHALLSRRVIGAKISFTGTQRHSTLNKYSASLTIFILSPHNTIHVGLISVTFYVGGVALTLHVLYAIYEFRSNVCVHDLYTPRGNSKRNAPELLWLCTGFHF
jgi:hypothetical protein